MNVARDRPDAERRASLVDAFRILVGEVADIEHQATDEAVHTARKTAKRARAALRLMRSAIGDAAYHRANKQLRDAARPLTVVRDAVAILGALNHIRKPRDNKRLNSYVSWVYQRLHNEYRASRKEFRQQDIRLSVITLRAVRRRMGHLAASQSDVLSARHGITKTYKNGREASSRARLRPASTDCTNGASRRNTWRTSWIWHGGSCACDRGRPAGEPSALARYWVMIMTWRC